MKLLYFLVLGYFFAISANAQFISTSAGGSWGNKDTWAGTDQTPKAGDNVIINGAVYGTGECNNLIINPSGILQRATITVNGDLLNKGIIRNDEPGSTGNLLTTITVYGNIKNMNYWQTSEVFYRGDNTHQHQLYLADTSHSAFGSLKAYPSSSTCIVNADTTALKFINTKINLSDSGVVNLNGVKELHLDKSEIWYSLINLNGGKVKFKNKSAMALNGGLKNATIEDTLYVGAGNCRMTGEIINDGVVKDNVYGASTDFTVTGSLTNNGKFSNHDLAGSQDYRSLIVNVTGNLINNGTFDNGYIKLTGSSDQNVTFNQPVHSKFFQITDSTGNVIAKTDLYFYNTAISGNKANLLMGNYKLHNTPSGSFYDIKINNATLTGTISLSYDVEFTGNLVVSDTLMEKSNVVVTSFNCDVTNNGYIIDNPENTNGNLEILLFKDIINNNEWGCKITRFESNADQKISATKPFSGKYFYNTNVSSKIIAETPISFENTIVQLGNYQERGNLILSENSGLTITGTGYLNYTNIEANNNYINLSGGSYVTNCSIKDPVMKGEFYIHSNTELTGNIINEGTLSNRENNNVTCIVDGDFINKGSVLNNNTNTLKLELKKDIENKGIWDIYDIKINGDVDQTVKFDAGKTIKTKSYFYSDKGTSSYQWQLNGTDLSGKTSSYFTKDSIGINDVGEYVCNTDQGTSRKILVISNYLTADFHADTTVVMQNDTVKFVNSSVGYIGSYLWDFGDGTTSTEKDPKHVYENTGTYSVKLIVSYNEVSDTLLKQNYITVLPLTDIENDLPLEYRLDQNYPNPFNPSTVISFEIPEETKVTLEIFNILGQKIKTLVNEVLPAGKYKKEFDASRFSSGVYIYIIKTDKFFETRKMVLTK
ncbi:MAG: PKD domain-containing protein [Rhodothermaceae bacterium]